MAALSYCDKLDQRLEVSRLRVRVREGNYGFWNEEVPQPQVRVRVRVGII